MGRGGKSCFFRAHQTRNDMVGGKFGCRAMTTNNPQEKNAIVGRECGWVDAQELVKGCKARFHGGSGALWLEYAPGLRVKLRTEDAVEMACEMVAAHYSRLTMQDGENERQEEDTSSEDSGSGKDDERSSVQELSKGRRDESDSHACCRRGIRGHRQASSHDGQEKLKEQARGSRSNEREEDDASGLSAKGGLALACLYLTTEDWGLFVFCFFLLHSMPQGFFFVKVLNVGESRKRHGRGGLEHSDWCHHV